MYQKYFPDCSLENGAYSPLIFRKQSIMISPDLKINSNEIPDANAEVPIGKIHSML